MGIAQDKIDSAAKASANASANRILNQAVAYAIKLAKTETISTGKILDEIARQSGIELAPRKPPGRKNPPTKGEQNG